MRDSKLMKPGKWYAEFDENGACTKVVHEASYLRHLGYECEAEYANAQETWMNSIHPDDKKRVKAHLAAFLEKHPDGMDFDIEYRMMTGNGYRWFHDYAHASRRADGSVLRADGVVFNIQDSVDAKENMGLTAALADVTKLNCTMAIYLDFAGETSQILYRKGLNPETYEGIKTPLSEAFVSLGTDYINIHTDDRERLRKFFEPENMRETLNSTERAEFSYRDISAEYGGTYRTILIRGEDEDHALVLLQNISEELLEQQKRILGTVPLSPDILEKSDIGLWAFELDEGKPPRMYVDNTMLGLLGLKHQLPPEETYHAWYDHVDEESYELVHDAVGKMSAGEHAEVQYPWHHPDGHTMIVRCGGVSNPGYTGGIRIEGTHQDVSAILRFDEAENRRAREAEKMRKQLIAKMAGGVSLYIVNTETMNMQVLSRDKYLTEHYSAENEEFEPSLARYICNDVFEPDRKAAEEAISIRNIAAQLEAADEYNFLYRDISSGSPRWYEMRAVKLSEKEVVLSFNDQNAGTINRMIFNKLRENYFELYYVNLDTGMAQILKSGHPAITGGEDSEVPYTELMNRIASESDGEAREFLTRIGSIDFLIKGFMEEETGFYVYKSHIFEGDRWVNVTGLVLARHEDGTPSVLSLGFSLLDEDAGRRQEAQSKLEESLAVVGGLANEYTALYHVNLDTGNYVSYYLTDRTENIKPFYENNPKFADLAHAFANSGLVRPDDRDALMAMYPSDEEVRNALEGKEKLSMLFKRNYDGEYLWTELSIIKCEGINETAHNIIVGFIEMDEEVREREASFKAADDANKLVDNIAARYSVAFTVNMKTGEFHLLKVERSLTNKFESFSSYAEARNALFAILHDYDKDRVMRELEFDNIRENLKNRKSYTSEYRTAINGVTKWHEMSVTYIDENEVALGFAEKDLEITQRHLESKRYDEYLALFVVDLDTEMIKPLKVSNLFHTAAVGESVPYTYGMKKFADSYEGEAKEFFTQISDPSVLRRDFAADDKRTFSYKSAKIGGENWIDVVCYVILRHEDGTPAMVTLGFSVVDALATARKELLDRLNEDMQMIGGLASEYHALYYFNIDENIFKVYSLDGEKLPKAASMVQKSQSVTDMFRNFAASELIHPEDKHLFYDLLTIDELRARLANRKRFSVTFRRNFNGEYLWTVMDVVKYEDVDEQANAIAVGFANRDAQIRAEQAVNTAFDVLAQELSSQEAVDRILSIAGDFYGAERSYVFEYAKRTGTINNTYEWCKDGIEPMIGHLQNVPLEAIEGWNREFERQGAFYMDALDSEHNTEETVAILEMQGIQSLVAAPLMNGGEIVGFVGVDNPTKAKKDISILSKASSVIFSEILQRKENDEEHVTLGKLTDAFLSVYYVDLSTDYMRTWKIAEEYQNVYAAVRNYSVSMGGYVRENIAERDRERCIEMTSPGYVLRQFELTDRFSIEMTDTMLGYERNVVADYIKVNEDGTCFVICFRDMTDALAKEKEQQKQLEEARIAAEAANRSKTSFLFNMSHDIRTPMNAITGFTSMAKKHLEEKDKVADYLDKIETSGHQLLTLVNQVLEMARIESGRIELEEKPVNVREQYAALVTVLAEQAKGMGLEFRNSLGEVVHDSVFADVGRVNSITLNITGNAMKYTPRGGRVDYALREIPARKEGYASFVFTVEDSGIGMSEEYLKELYEPFTREKNSTVSKIQGTGLGMSIVKELVDLMGGTIEVRSELGKGTRFDVTIDFKICENETGLAQVHPDAEVSFAGQRVLLVDDNALNREIALEILDDEGFISDAADDGTTAVEMLREKGADFYNFILMDIQMPVMNGYEATKIIREMYPDEHIPIIALSANAFAEDKTASLAAGMDGHVAKPINIKELLAVLAKFL